MNMDLQNLRADYLFHTSLSFIHPILASQHTSLISLFFYLILSLILFLLILFITRRLMYLVHIVMEKPVFLELTPPTNFDKTQYSSTQLFSVIHSLGMQQTLIDKITDRKVITSFEIVSTREKGIRYIVKTTETHKESLRNAILSYLPSLTIQEREDYILSDIPHTILEFTLSKHYAFPLRKQDTLARSDPVSYITGMMTQLKHNELIALQIVVSPVNPQEVLTIRQKILSNEHVLSYLNRNHFPISIYPLFLVFSIVSFLVSGLSWLVSDLFFTNNDHGVLQQMTNLNQMVDAKIRPARIISSFEQEAVASVSEKIYQPLFQTSVRVFISTQDKKERKQRARGIVSSFAPFTVPRYQSLSSIFSFPIISQTVGQFTFRYRLLSSVTNSSHSLLSSQELADIYHFPNTESTKIEHIVKNLSLDLPAPLLLKQNNQLDVVFGKNEYRNEEIPIGLTDNERSRHVYMIGQTGSGKSTILYHCTKDDIQKGKGLCVIDPHGDLIEDLLSVVPEERIEDVVYINPFDISYPISINLLELTSGLRDDEQELEKELVVESVISLFRRIFSRDENTNSHRIEHILRNTIYTAFYVDGATLFTINTLLTNEEYRKEILETIDNQDLLDFWNGEFGKAGDYQVFKTISGVTAKIERFLFSPIAKRMLEKPKSTISFDELLDKGKIILCNLSEGKIGEDTSQLIGTTIITKIHLSTLRRARMEKSLRKPFYLYIDEFQNFATSSFTKLLSGGRKFGLRVTIAEQSTTQQEDSRITNMILANVGTIICFRTASPMDEKLILPLLVPDIKQGDIANLPRHHFYIKLGSIEPTEPFSGVTLPIDMKKDSNKEKRIIDESRKNYTKKYVKLKEEKRIIKKSKRNTQKEKNIDNGLS